MSFLYPYFLVFILPIAIFRKKNLSLAQNMRWLALVLLIIAISRPIIKKAHTKELIRVHSIIIALDVSASMKANDIKPNRLIASKKTIKKFLSINRQDLISLVAFTTNPLLLSPFTIDHKLISTALDTLNEKYILTKGTSIKKLIKKVSKFPSEDKLLIIFSDGGDKDIDNSLISYIKANNIKILTIATATQKGSTISLDNQELLKDKKGHIVISKLNPQIYKLGEVIPFNNPKDTALDIESWIEDIDSAKRKIEQKSSNNIELFFIPTLFALVLIFLSSTKFISKVIWILALLGFNAQAYDIFDDFYINSAYDSYRDGDYNKSLNILSKISEKTIESELIRANDYYKINNYKMAKEILLSIKTTNPKIKQQILYNLGNCEAKLSYYSKAKDYYIKALAFGEDSDILHNLEIVIFLREKYKSKLGFTNPKSPQNSNSNSNIQEIKSQNSNSKKASGDKGGDSKNSKASTTNIKKLIDSTPSKNQISSKAYELINKGYINEDKPW